MKIRLSGYVAIAIALSFLIADLAAPGYRRFAPFSKLSKETLNTIKQIPSASAILEIDNPNNCSNPQYKAIVESLQGKGQCHDKNKPKTPRN